MSKMRVLANLGYQQQTSIKSQQWKTDGSLMYDASSHKAIIRKDGLRIGKFLAITSIPEAPFLQGHIVYQLYDDKPDLYVGWITTSDNEDGDTAYSIHIANLPLIVHTPAVYLKIELEDDSGYILHGTKKTKQT